MITGTFTTAVGDISITMDDGGAGAYVKVSKLGNLKYEFDQTPDSVQIDRTIALYSYIQVEFLSLTESSEDLYTRLVDATATTPIDCTLSIDNFGVDTFDFSFELKQENIDYNEKEGTVAVRFTPKIDKEVTISNVFSSVTNYQYQPLQRDTVPDTLFNTNLNCLPVEDYLEASMQSVFANNFDAYIKLSKTSSNVSYFRSNASWDDGTNGFVIVDPVDLPLPLKVENFQEPEELTVTANVTSSVTVFGPYNDNGITVDYFSYYEYYVEATDLFNEFPVGTAIGWFADDQTVGPLGILRSKSSTSNVVVVGPVITETLPIGSTAPVGGSEQILTNTRIFVYDSELNQVANDSIKELAGIEGSIYGTGFSKNFYVHRLSDNDTEYVTLNYDLVSEIKQKKLNKFLQATVVRQIADYNNEGFNQFGQIPNIEIGTGLTRSLRIPLMRGSGAFVRGNENATKSLEINLAPVYPFLNKASKTGNRYIAFSATSNTAQTALERSITSAGARSYAQSLNQQSGGTKIEFTYFDALALKPYEVFQFDSTAPEKYQNKQYRITSIAYDFVKNESKVVGYQISNLSAPVVIDDTDDTDNGGGETTEPPVTGQGFTYKPGWNFISNPTDTDKDVLDVFGDDYVDLTLYQFAGGYVVEPPTSSLYNKVLASNNGSPAGVYKTPGYVINLQSSSATQYFWDGQRQESNVTNIELFEGWNLIGSIGVPATLQPSASNAAGIDDQAVFGFNGSYYLTGFNLLPGQSYWAWSSNTGNVDIVTASASTSNAVNLHEDFKRISIRTSSATQFLYFDGTNTNTNINIQQAFLPPPIGATFDARINQSKTNAALRNLRAVESNTVSIDVQQIDSATTLNITPKIGDAASSSYQCTFLSGYDIITASNVTENVAVDIPPLTTQIQVKPMGNSILLPVRDIDFTNPDGTIPERFIDRSDVLSFTPSSTLIVIPVTTETIAVNMTLGDKAQYNFIAFGIDTPRNGQEILVTVRNPDEKQFLISQGSTAYSPLLLPGDTQIERSEDNVVFKFRYNDALSGWVLVYENSQGAISDPIPEPNPGIVAAPSFIPSEGTYTGNTNLSIVTTTSGADIFYNTDGSNTYLAYTSPIVLTEGSSYNVRAYATKSGLQTSENAYSGYVINVGSYPETPDLPVIVPSNQSFYNSLNVEMYTSNSNPARTSNIYYTIDGTLPDANSTRYAGAITIYNDTLFRAVAKYDDSSELTDVVDKSYTKITSGTPSANKWSIISHPFAYPLTERAIRQIFNSRKATTFGMTDNETWVKVSNYIDDLSQGVDAPLPVKAEPGRGYWIYVDNPIESLDFNGFINTRFNLLSNDNEHAQSESFTTLPYYWSGSNSGVVLNASLQDFVIYNFWEIEFVPSSYPYETRLYLDEIVIRNYQSSNYTLDATMFASYQTNANIKFGVETYDITKASTSNTNTAITVTGAVEDFSEEFTGITGYYVRPFIEVSETAQDAQRLKLYIRKQKFSAEPGFMLNTVSHNVSNGWSTVGAIGGRSNINTDGSIIGDIFSYSSGVYAVENIDNLRIGRGYFVQFANSNTYNVQLTDEVPQAGVNLNNSYKRVQLSRQDGVFSVFFDGTSNTINASEYTVPPAVGDNFDVRINQDETNVSLRDRRVIESNTINIDVQQIDSATTLNINPSIFYYVDGATDASPTHTANIYTALSGYSLASACTQYDTGSLYYTTGPSALQNFQATFLDGDKIITAQNIAENVAVDVPITTTRITLQPMGANIKLPVRARDIANDDGEILDTVAIAGATGAISDRIQYLNNTGVITRIETTEDAPEFRPVKNLQLSAASYDDYALPTGTIFGVVGISSPYSVTFTGFRDEGGREVTFISRPGVTITFNHEDSNSDAGHRFVLPSSSNVTISEYQTATFVYVTLENRWYLISNT